MVHKWKQIESRFELFLLLFIILQPVLDLLTSFSILVLNIHTTAGIIVRLLIMVISGLYVIVKARDRENRKYILYILALGLIFTAGLVNNQLIKSPILLGEELKFIAKGMYPFIMLSSYIIAFRSLKQRVDIGEKVRNFVLYSTLIINAVMVISIVTSTDYNSYDYVKSGSKGWFFAGNELGAILAISLPIVVLYSIQKTRAFAQSYYWIPSLLTVLSLIAVGTKVGYGAILLVFAVAAFMCLVRAGFERKQAEQKRVLLVNGMIASIIFIGSILALPFTPIAENTNLHIQLLEEQTKTKPDQEKEKTEEELEKEKQEETEALLFSGRQLFAETYKIYFEKAPLTQKLLGMGYGGNFEEEPKLVERDFHDFFYSFGIIGFLLVMIPFGYYGLRAVLALFKRFMHIFNVKYALFASSLALGLGIAYTAGHVLTAPAVSLYFVVLWAYLVVDLEIE